MAIGDVYELVQKFQYLGELAQNVYHYVQKAGTLGTSAAELASGFNFLLKPEILAGMSSACEYIELKTVNLMDATDFNIFTTSDFGTIATTPSNQGAKFLAWSWRFEQLFPGAPVGHKRYTGVAETITSDNIYVLPGATEVNMKNIFENDLPGGTASNVYHLVIVKRPFSILVPPTIWFEVAIATYTNLSTQNTRKR